MKARGKTSKGQVRIIGGERRGHRLHFVDQRGDLRPSSDRMRETLFNGLQAELAGALVPLSLIPLWRGPRKRRGGVGG